MEYIKILLIAVFIMQIFVIYIELKRSKDYRRALQKWEEENRKSYEKWKIKDKAEEAEYIKDRKEWKANWEEWKAEGEEWKAGWAEYIKDKQEWNEIKERLVKFLDKMERNSGPE